MGLRHFDIKFHELSIEPKIGLKDYSVLYGQGIRNKKTSKKSEYYNGYKIR